jgi:hypothetical protein
MNAFHEKMSKSCWSTGSLNTLPTATSPGMLGPSAMAGAADAMAVAGGC